jgi:hypothetical protein
MILVTGCTQSPDEIIKPPTINTSSGGLEQPVVNQTTVLTELDFEKTPVDIVYTWVYRGKNHSVNVTLFEEEFQYFAGLNRTGSDRVVEFFIPLIHHEWQQDTIEEIVADLKAYGYDDKETVRLALAMVHTMPYNNTYDRWTYAYETMYARTGVCSDKVFLATAILDNLGYDTVIFDYDAENHMSIGIKCQKEYAYWDEYCFADVTIGHSFITDSNLTSVEGVRLGEPSKVYDASTGTKSFDASWDYIQSQKLGRYIESQANHTAWLTTTLDELDWAVPELQAYRQEIFDTDWPSKAAADAAIKDYEEFLAEYYRVKEMWDGVYSEWVEETRWLIAYEREYGVDLGILKYIGADRRYDLTDTSSVSIIVG